MDVELDIPKSDVDMEQASDKMYVVKTAKLIKFRDSKLTAVKFTQSGSKGKLLITFD